jgi:uncharacterized protein (TIGR02246 family)
MGRHEVLDLVQRWAKVERAGDPDGYGSLLSADFTAIGPVGFVLDKQQWAARHRGDLRNEHFEIEDPTVRHYGADTAIVTAIQDQVTKVNGHNTSGRFRLVVVAVRSDDHWSIANIQLSGPMRAPGEMPDFAKKEKP